MFFRPISSAVCFFVLLSTTLVMAKTVTWNGSSLYEHDWRTTVNWTDLQGGALYPDNGVNVSIPGGEVDVAAGQRYRVGDLGISAAGQVSLYGTLDVDKTVTVSPRSSSQPSYVMINPGGTLNVGQNVQLGENCNIFLELDGKVNIAGNITGANNATLWLYDEFNVGKTFNVPQVNIYNDANLKVKRLAGGMDLTLRYASSGYVDNGYQFEYAPIVVEKSSIINSLTVTVDKYKTGIYSGDGFAVFGGDGEVDYGSPVFNNNSELYLELTGDGRIVFDDAQYVTEGLVWNYDEEQYFNNGGPESGINIKLVGSANPEIILTIYDPGEKDMGTLAALFQDYCYNSGARFTPYGSNQLLLTGSFMDDGFAYMFYEWYIEGPQIRIEGLERREIVTPEPATWVLMLLGGGGLLWIRKKYSRNLKI